jgi:hypothetical protein
MDRPSMGGRRRSLAYCGAPGAVPAGAGAAAGLPVRRVWRRSWRPWRLVWRRFIPWVPVVAAGAAAGAASCASASDGSSAADSVRPNAAPRPSRASAFRRETSSVISILPLSTPARQPRTFSYERRLNMRRRPRRSFNPPRACQHRAPGFGCPEGAPTGERARNSSGGTSCR